MHQHRLIGLDDRQGWMAALDGMPHAFAHTWESCHAMHLTIGQPVSLYVAEGSGSKVVCPIAVRRVAAHTDVFTPYGFGGFLAQGDDTDLTRPWRDFARQQGWVSGYIGLNPIFSPAACRLQPDYVEYNEIYVLNLTLHTEELYAALSENRQRQVRSASLSDWRIEDRRRLREFFLDHVSAFHMEHGASAAYAFSRATFEALLALDNVLLLGSGDEKSVTAVSIFAWTPSCAEYLFNVSRPEGRQYSAPIIWHAALRLRQMGIPLLNLGGGITKNDGVAQFKKRFGAKRMPLGSLRQVFRRDVYDQLCSEVGADPDSRSGYFPPFRKI